MLSITLIVASLMGISVVSGAGGIFPMKEEEFSNANDLLNGLQIGEEQLNAKNDRKENAYRMVATHIIKASKQIVSGTLYRVHATMEESDCKNVEDNKYKGVEDCPSNGNGASQTCIFTIWSRPWMKKFGKDVLIRGINCN